MSVAAKAKHLPVSPLANRSGPRPDVSGREHFCAYSIDRMIAAPSRRGARDVKEYQ